MNRCDCYSTNGWLYATPGGWVPCWRCGGTMELPASAIEARSDATPQSGAAEGRRPMISTSLLESAQTRELTFAISKFMAMGVEWDRAAAALKQRDYAAFDRHMAKFNEIKDSNEECDRD